jgi:hypothetical protein
MFDFDLWQPCLEMAFCCCDVEDDDDSPIIIKVLDVALVDILR